MADRSLRGRGGAQMDVIFSSDPVWSQTTKSGFRQQVFIMYHATSVHNVNSILDDGFELSRGQHCSLGNGLYVSKDIEKTLDYGTVCFKLLVYPGKSCIITEPSDPLRYKWHEDHSSAWIPANCGFMRGLPGSKNDKEETCVKSTNQVRILGIAYGYELLDYHTRRKVNDLFGTADSLCHFETRILDDFLEHLGIVYSSFVHEPSSLFLEVDWQTEELRVVDWTGRDNQLWSRTWDCCIENKATGRVITLWNDELLMEEVDGAGDKFQKWKRDRNGRIIQKAVGGLLAVDPDDNVELQPFFAASNESWRFRCMDTITKTTDSFVNFTPWQNMITW